ncbi:MAG TPA: hypothetical protein VGD37_40240 [Kofleriaceae bacterium]
MSRTDITDPYLADAGHEAERAEELLRARVEELKRKFDDVRARIDLSGEIHRHPWPAVGIAFAVGALAGVIRSGARTAAQPRSFTRVALGAVGALGLHVVRELAVGQLGRVAKSWLLDQDGGAPDAADGDDVRAPRTANIAPFLEH